MELLTFVPSTTFHPATQELMVLTGMKGTALVDTTTMRLVSVYATLFRPVNFGWGILARLNPGGSFVLEQEPIGNGKWAVTKVSLDFTGKLLPQDSSHRFGTHSRHFSLDASQSYARGGTATPEESRQNGK